MIKSISNLRVIAAVFGVGLLFLHFFSSESFAQSSPGWWNANWSYRTRLTTSTQTGTDSIVTADIQMDSLRQGAGGSNISSASFRVVDHQNNTLLTSQSEPPNTSTGTVKLSFFVPGQLSSANIFLYFDPFASATTSPQVPALVTLSEEQYQGQLSYNINTSRARYMYHKGGGGLAAMFDIQNIDWISFNTAAAGAGMFRGIPNFPDDKFHPGHNFATSTITNQGPLFIELKSTIGSDWETVWHFYPTVAKMKVTRAPANTPYWFLYEGTPGGSITNTATSKDKYVLANGTVKNINEVKEGDLPDPEWLYFYDPAYDRSLFFLHHEADNYVDRYALYNAGNMTVFGFGRDGNNKLLRNNNSFTIGFVESKVHSTVSQSVTTTISPIAATSGVVESRITQPSPSNSPRTSPRSSASSMPSSSPTGQNFKSLLLAYFSQVLDLSGDGMVNSLDFALLISGNPTPYPSSSTPPSPRSSPRTSPSSSPRTSPSASPRTSPGSGEKALFNNVIVQFVNTDNGFHYIHMNDTPYEPHIPTNWMQPVNYFTGTWQYRIQILEHPTGQTGKLQMCLWNMPGHSPENCAFNINHDQGVGTYTYASTPSINGAANGGWARIDGSPALDFLNPIKYKIGIVLRGPGNCVVTTKAAVDNKCPELFDQYKDMRFKLTVVMVPGGQSFSGWQNY